MRPCTGIVSAFLCVPALQRSWITPRGNSKSHPYYKPQNFPITFTPAANVKTYCMAVRAWSRKAFPNSSLDLTPPLGHSSETRFANPTHYVWDVGSGKRTVAKPDIENWYPCGAQDATYTRGTRRWHRPQGPSQGVSCEQDAPPLGCMIDQSGRGLGPGEVGGVVPVPIDHNH